MTAEAPIVIDIRHPDAPAYPLASGLALRHEVQQRQGLAVTHGPSLILVHMISPDVLAACHLS